MIAALVGIYVAMFLVWLDTRRIERKGERAQRRLHDADVIANSEPRGNVEIVNFGGGFRVR